MTMIPIFLPSSDGGDSGPPTVGGGIVCLLMSIVTVALSVMCAAMGVKMWSEFASDYVFEIMCVFLWLTAVVVLAVGIWLGSSAIKELKSALARMK